jgi:hypothetical protein
MAKIVRTVKAALGIRLGERCYRLWNIYHHI